VGRLAALLKLPQAAGEVTRAPDTLLRASAQGFGPPRSGAVSRVLRLFSCRYLAPRRTGLPGAGSARAASADLFSPRRAISPRHLRWPTRLHRHLAYSRLPFRLPLAPHSGTRVEMGRSGLHGGSVARDRACGGQGYQLREGLSLLPRRHRPPLRRLPGPARLNETAFYPSFGSGGFSMSPTNSRAMCSVSTKPKER
jgi:hypothetical protein